MSLTRKEATREACSITGLAFKSIGDYSYSSDGFCDLCPFGEGNHHEGSYQNSGIILDYVRRAVLEKLKRDGYKIHEKFDPETGKEK